MTAFEIDMAAVLGLPRPETGSRRPHARSALLGDVARAADLRAAYRYRSGDVDLRGEVSRADPGLKRASKIYWPFKPLCDLEKAGATPQSGLCPCALHDVAEPGPALAIPPLQLQLLQRLVIAGTCIAP